MECTTETISIIVPMHNVAAYLTKCLDSIKAQTYSALEIILVDDGSTDSTATLAQDYCAADPRFILVTQENQGPAAARNAGLKRVSGNYVLFVDADDYVSQDYVQYLYALLKKYHANISGCLILQFFDNPVVSAPEENTPEQNLLYDGSKALEALLYRKNFNASSYAKLYTAELLQGLTFPEYAIYAEDMAFVCQAFSRSKKTVLGTKKNYYYRQQPNSIMHTFDVRKTAALDVVAKIADDVQQNHPELINAAKSRMFVSAVQMLRNIPYKKCYRAECVHACQIAKKNRGTVLRDPKNKPSTRILAAGAYLSPYLLGLAGKFYSWVMVKFQIPAKY